VRPPGGGPDAGERPDGVPVGRTGSVGFKITAPGVEVNETTLPEISIGVVIGSHCSVGTVPQISLRQKGRLLVYP
jgi:hypothetical protein